MENAVIGFDLIANVQLITVYEMSQKCFYFCDIFTILFASVILGDMMVILLSQHFYKKTTNEPTSQLLNFWSNFLGSHHNSCSTSEKDPFVF